MRSTNHLTQGQTGTREKLTRLTDQPVRIRRTGGHMRTLRSGCVRPAPSRKISGALTPGNAMPAPQGLPSYSGAALQAPTAAPRVERTSHDIRPPSHPATANNAARQAQGTHVGSHISAEDGLQMHGRGRSTKPAPPFWSSEKKAVPGPSPTIPYAPSLPAGPTSTHAGPLLGGRPGPHTRRSNDTAYITPPAAAGCSRGGSGGRPCSGAAPSPTRTSPAARARSS